MNSAMKRNNPYLVNYDPMFSTPSAFNNLIPSAEKFGLNFGMSFETEIIKETKTLNSFINFSGVMHERNSDGLIQQTANQLIPCSAGQLQPLQAAAAVAAAQCAAAQQIALHSPANIVVPGLALSCADFVDNAKKPKLDQMSPTFAHGAALSLNAGIQAALNSPSGLPTSPPLSHSLLTGQLNAMSPQGPLGPGPMGPGALVPGSLAPGGMGPGPLGPGSLALLNQMPSTALGKPSKVLHFRGVPTEVTEGEIIQLGQPFGKMTNLVLAKKKNQALLEMADISAAQQMASYFGEHPPLIRGRVVYIQYSNHEELKVEASQQAALAVTQNNLSDEPRTVLRVIIEQMLYPVTIEILKQVFSKYGTVLKIVTFNKNNSFQALIEYADSIAAQTTKLSLNGQNIYNGCCTLRVDFSKLSSLNVKFNNEKSRDYTNPHLPGCDINLMNPMSLGNLTPLNPVGDMIPLPHIQMPPAFPTGPGTPNALFPVGATPFGPLAPPPFHGSPNGASAAPQATAGALTPFEVAAVTATANGFPQLPGGPMNFGPLNQALRFPIPCSPVLLISGLNEETVTPDSLFMLFGVYGDVLRVKILFNKKDTALIQFSTAHQAQVAMQHLDRLKLWGKMIKCAHSKHVEVQLPREGQSDAGLTKDYSQSPLHRFKKPNSKNHHNIFPPSATLHLSNIPSTTNEEYLLKLFESHGNVIAFKFFQRDHRMALVQMGSIEEAVFALMALHNSQLAETAHLRVSFSKSTINSAMEALKM